MATSGPITYLVVQFTDRRAPNLVSDLGFHVAYMFATDKSKDQ